MFLVLFTGQEKGSTVVHVGNARSAAATLADMLNRSPENAGSYSVEELPTPRVGEFLTNERLSKLLNRGAGRNGATGKVTATEGGPLGEWLRELKGKEVPRRGLGKADSLDAFLEFEPLAVTILVALKENWEAVRLADREEGLLRLRFGPESVRVVTGGH